MTSLISDVGIFFSTSVKDATEFAAIGNWGMENFQYLFNGKTILIRPRDIDQQIEVHHVASFHSQGVNNHSRTSPELTSEQSSMLKTIVAIVFLAPTLAIGIFFKLFSYSSPDVRENHRLIKKHFTPIDRTIGDPVHRVDISLDISSPLKDLLTAEYHRDPLHPPTSNLIIYGSKKFPLCLIEDPGILQFNPMHLILDHVYIIDDASKPDSLGQKIRSMAKWRLGWQTAQTKMGPAIPTLRFNTIPMAINSPHPSRGWSPWSKRYHKISSIAN